MNRNEYDSGNYSGYRQQPPSRTPYHYQNPHLTSSSRNDYEVNSMLSTRSLPQRDYSWEHRSRVDSPYERRASEISRLQSQYTRLEPPYHGHHNYKMDISPTRREYSPLRKVSKGLDGVFKGFTTALPGNDPGYIADVAELEHNASVRTPSSRRYSEVDRASLYRGLSNAGSMSGSIGAAASVPATGSDLYANSYRYRDRPEYSANPSYLMDDYPPEPSSRYLHEASKRYEPPSAYAAHAAPSVSSANGQRSANCYRWNPTAATPPQPPPPTSCWELDAEPASPRLGEQPLSPRTFKRECQRAFKEARAQRMRNLEEGLYGKCDWATFDAKYC